MLVSTKSEPDFSRGCAGKRIGLSLFATHPHPAIRELTHASLDNRSVALRGLVASGWDGGVGSTGVR